MKRKLMSFLVMSTVIGTVSPVFAGYLEDMEAAGDKDDRKLMGIHTLRAANKLFRPWQRELAPRLQIHHDVFRAGMTKRYTISKLNSKIARKDYPPYEEIRVRYLRENNDGGWNVGIKLIEQGSQGRIVAKANITLASDVLTESGRSFFRRLESDRRKEESMNGHNYPNWDDESSDDDKPNSAIPEWMH